MQLPAINKHTILYAAALAALLVLMQWLQYRFLITDHALELYTAAIAIVFTSLGIWLALKLAAPKKETIIIEKEVIVMPPIAPVTPAGQVTAASHGLSSRELEVLQLMAAGCSNQEIAARLFLSLSTIKTHSSRLFEKMDVNRRTQAVDKARKMGIIP